MSINNFNPVQFIYLNPELNTLSTVEEAYTFFENGGSDLGLYSNVSLPTNWNYKIYITLNSQVIETDLPDLYEELFLTDPERLAIIHHTRYNYNNIYKYSIATDFKQEIYRTFNDVGVTHKMPSEYYIDYINRSNLGLLNGIEFASMGTIKDFMLNLLNQQFESGYKINSDLTVTGTTTTSNIIIKNQLESQYIYAANVFLSNLNVDTLEVNNTSFIDTIFEDKVVLSNDFTVLGTNAIFSNNVQVSNLTVINTSEFNNNVTMKKQLTVDDISIFNNNVELKSDLQINNNLLTYGYAQIQGNCTFNSELNVNNIVTFDSNLLVKKNVNINSNLIVNEITTLNSNIFIYGTSTFDKYVKIDNVLNVTSNVTFSNDLQINSNLSVLNNVIINNNLNVGKDVTFSNNLQINSNLTVLLEGKFNSLQVKDDVAFSNNLIVTNNIWATEFITVSDNRLKTNITDLDIIKSKKILQNIQVKEYDLYNSKKKHIGIIAQDLEIINNQLVRTLDKYKINLYKYLDRDFEYKFSENKYIYFMPIKLLSEGDIITYTYDNENNKEYKGTVNIIDDNRFIINNEINIEKHQKIFIIDRTVINFKAINYEELTMLCISCIQDIYKKLKQLEYYN